MYECNILYFRALFDAGRHGDAREESVYGPLATLVEAMAVLHDKTGLHVTTPEDVLLAIGSE